MEFSVDLDISGAVKLTNAIAKQVPFAMAKALTQTAIQAQTDIVQGDDSGLRSSDALHAEFDLRRARNKRPARIIRPRERHSDGSRAVEVPRS